VVSVVGTRPNFMKTAPIVAQLARAEGEFEPVLVHTGQHYDDAMSRIFLEELGIGEPGYFLGVGSGPHGRQTARVIERMEPLLEELRPELVIVPGDVNSTLAAALTAAKLNIPVAHVEAGLRSWDWSMPEEVNRVLTDRLSDLLFTHSPEAEQNLRNEGIVDGRIHYVGNTMIDSLRRFERRARERRCWEQFDLPRSEYLLVTLHRPSNVDEPDRLRRIVSALRQIAERHPVIFPAHPRTQQRMNAAQIDCGKVRVVDPISYLAMLDLLQCAYAVITDSGGVQEETTALGIPCLTVRENTERPVTITEGTNVLVPNPDDLPGRIAALEHSRPTGRVPDGWDGRASARIVEALEKRRRTPRV
jgi:UDP-N-acetylglucosamine 2-epimerase (non-hydrolysing)